MLCEVNIVKTGGRPNKQYYIISVEHGVAIPLANRKVQVAVDGPTWGLDSNRCGNLVVV